MRDSGGIGVRFEPSAVCVAKEIVTGACTDVSMFVSKAVGSYRFFGFVPSVCARKENRA